MRNIFWVCLLSIYVVLLPFNTFGSPVVSITTDAFENRIEKGETFHITVSATDCSGKLNVTEMPPGVKVVYHTTSQSSSQQTINGKTSVSNTTSLIMTCKGETPGDYSFGPVSVDGKKSNVLKYKIIPATKKSGSPDVNNQNHKNSVNTSNNTQQLYNPNSGPMFIGTGNEEMFLKAIVNKNSVYEQEAVEYIVKLYTTYGDIKFLGAAAAPKFDGFVVEESTDISNSLKFEEYNGKTYKTAIIARYIIFPQKSGELSVKGNTYTVSTDARHYYHDPYFQTLTVKYPIQLNVTPNDIKISVKELPAPIPDDFIGGVGNFTMTSNISSSNLTTNNAVSYTIKVEGTGNIKYVKLPEFSHNFPRSFEVFSPEINSDIKVGSSNVSGSIKFDYSVVPGETGDFNIPRLHFSYFDPENREYKTLETKEFDVHVNLGSESVKSQQTKTFDSELMPIGKLQEKNELPYVLTLGYWLWYIIPVIIFIISYLIYRKYIKEHEDLVGLRSKKANKMALKRLAKAYQCYKNHEEEQFYEEMLSALWGYLGDKLKMPTSELNRSNVSEEFKKHGVRVQTFMPIINLIDECEYAKYTPVARDTNMSQLYKEAIESLAKVENEYEEQTRSLAQNSDKEMGAGSSTNYINSSKSSDLNNLIDGQDEN